MSLRKSLLNGSVLATAALLAGQPRAFAQTAPVRIGATAPASVAQETELVDHLQTMTPIKHIVIIFNEGVSYDHYFATYPLAANPPGEPAFTPALRTPQVNNLKNANLLSNNPNFANPLNQAGAAEPFRLDPAQAASADQNRAYTSQQQAYDGGKADLFPKYTGKATLGGAGAFGTTGQVLGYYDGNTVTALWNYASHFAQSDNAFTDTYGSSTPGALAVISGQTNGLKPVASSDASAYVNDGQGGLTLINDVDPAYDICSNAGNQAYLTGKNIGDLLNAANIPWGGFMGGFNVQGTNPNGTTGCARSTSSTVVDQTVDDYVAHHNWFQYFASTANYNHARPMALTDIGYSFASNGAADPANHQYDLTDFRNAVASGNFPAVSYIKLAAFQDGHAGYSDPLDEQRGVVQLVNFLQSQPDWKNTAVIVTYDDAGGWYDHEFVSPTNPSLDPTADMLNGPGICGTGTPAVGVAGNLKPVNGRCGPGARIPFLVISPWARQNYVNHSQITQASVVRFIEYNWLNNTRLGNGAFDNTAGPINGLFDFAGAGNAPALLLDPATGEPD